MIPEDVTLKHYLTSSGVHYTRNCFTCSKHKNDRGGRIDKRTRMWSCEACVLTKQEKRNEDTTRGTTG